MADQLLSDPLFSVEGKIAVITGGARGLGFSYAQALASRGAKVAIVDVNEQLLNEAQAELSRYGEIAAYTADVSDEPAVIDLSTTILQTYGHIDILVNNAGVVQRVTAEEMSGSEWDRVMNVNAKGTFLCCRYLGVSMKERRKGKIVNICSIAGRMGLDRRLAYCTSKAAVEHLTRTLAAEWGEYNVNVNAIGPGYIKSDMNADLRADPVRYETMVNQVPMKRFGEPEDLHGALLFLVSSASDYVNGQAIFVDGGLLTI